ncbi:hypothetical protein [Frankia sp. AgKG'84/4]|uniref:hypothetical protein n=1 Tax=Frankia sp. AgKG'84/4 TaxID=573490 RepID=UPI00200DAA66|nr:hypothetical protein [Frankia sp. AgKG'84/4]
MALFVAAVLIIIVFLWSGPLSWPAATLLLLLGGLGVLVLFRRGSPSLNTVPWSAPIPASPVPPPPPPARQHEHRLSEVRVPSSTEDYEFLFSATVRWVQRDPHQAGGNQAGAACDAIVQRAWAITKDRPAIEAALVAHELGAQLGMLEHDGSGRLVVMAESVTLVLPPEDQARLGRLAQLRKDEAVWDQEWKRDMARRQRLTDDVLADFGRTVAWSFARNDHKVDPALSELPHLARLAAIVHDRDLPDRFARLGSSPEPVFAGEPEVDAAIDADDSGTAVRWRRLSDIPVPRRPDTPADRLDRLLDATGLARGEDIRMLLADQIVALFREYEMADLANELSRFPTGFGSGAHEASDDTTGGPASPA